jgi:Metallopeptidase toxin 2
LCPHERIRAVAGATATVYARQKGYLGRTSIINAVGKSKGSDIAFFDPNTKTLTVRKGAFDAGFMTNVYDFKSTLNHEIEHSKDPKTYGDPKEYKYMDHVAIYLLEAKDPDFKHSTDWNKISNANQYMLRVFNAFRMHELVGDVKAIYDAVDKYNKENSGGLKIIYSFAMEASLMSFTTSLDGKLITDNYYKYETISNAQD